MIYLASFDLKIGFMQFTVHFETTVKSGGLSGKVLDLHASQQISAEKYLFSYWLESNYVNKYASFII